MGNGSYFMVALKRSIKVDNMLKNTINLYPLGYGYKVPNVNCCLLCE